MSEFLSSQSFWKSLINTDVLDWFALMKVYHALKLKTHKLTKLDGPWFCHESIHRLLLLNTVHFWDVRVFSCDLKPLFNDRFSNDIHSWFYVELIPIIVFDQRPLPFRIIVKKGKSTVQIPTTYIQVHTRNKSDFFITNNQFFMMSPIERPSESGCVTQKTFQCSSGVNSRVNRRKYLHAS